MSVAKSIFVNSLFIGLLVLVSGCGTVSSRKVGVGATPVRQVDFSKAPELKELAEHARQFGNEMYPKVCALFAEDGVKPPLQFDLTLKPIRSDRTGETCVELRSIRMNSTYLTNDATGWEMFDKVFVHEMAHLVLLHNTVRWSRPHFGWEEGLADYAYFKLIGTNGWGCPQCDYRYPHYTAGYTCAGAFLLYVESMFGTNVICQLKSELRQGRYTDAFFLKATGKSLDALWADFQKTAAFKPGAVRALELTRVLGFEGGELPRNASARFNKYVAQHADDFTKQAIKSVTLDRKASKDVRGLMVVYLYLTQPGGSAEKVWLNLRENGRIPGIIKGEKGALIVFFKYDEIAAQDYPLSRTLTARKRGEACVYHYTMRRATPESDWKLTKAWRAGPDEKVVEEYPVP